MVSFAFPPAAFSLVAAFALAFAASPAVVHAIEDIESGVPAGWSATSGSITASAERFKSGRNSLRWDWNQPVAELRLPVARPIDKPGAKSGFAFWLHQTEAHPARLRVRLLHGGKVVGEGWFWMDFHGWRILGAGYGQFGVAPGQAVDAIHLSSPEGRDKGSLFLDMIDLARDFNATRSITTPWVGMPGGLANPELVVLSESDPSRNRPWLPGPRAPSPAELEEIQRLEAVFLSSKSGPGRGLPPGRLAELRALAAGYGIVEEGGFIRGRAIDGGTALKPADHIPIGEFLKSCEALKNAWYQAKEETEAAELEAMFVLFCRHLLDQGFAPGFRLAAFDNYPFPQYACFFAMKAPLVRAGLAAPMARALIDNFGSHAPFDFAREFPASTMDGLGYWNRELFACSLLFPEPGAQLQHLAISKRFLDLAILHPTTIAPDGCPYHHGGFHFAYASYTMPRLLQSLEKTASSPFRIAPAAHERLRVYARAMAATSSKGEQAYNLGMRAGTPMSTMGVEPVARMLATMGPPDGGASIDPDMAGLSLWMLAEAAKDGQHANFTRDPWKSWLDQGLRPLAPPAGFLPLNGGPVAIHRGENWLAAIAGITPHYRCIEIYGWTQSNNYGRFARNASLVITSRGNPPDLRESGWTTEGWNWCHFPGTTSPKVTREFEIFDGYAMYGSSTPNVGGTRLGKNGVWGQDFDGIGIRFRKTYFCFDRRITSVTTSIRSSKPGNPHPLVTTLFQNALDPDSESVLLDGQSAGAFPVARDLEPGGARWLMDNKNTGYILHPDNNVLRVRLARQSWRYMVAKNLVAPARNPISGEINYQNVKGKIKDLSTIEDFYRPTEGDFATAWFDHGPNPDGACAIYTAVVLSSPEEMARLAADPAHRILQHDDRAHVLFDQPSGTFAHAIYESSPAFAGDSPLRSCDHPCFLMLAPAADRIRASLVFAAGGNSIPPDQRPTIELTLAGKWKLVSPRPGLAASPGSETTVLHVTPSDNTPILFDLVPP